MAYLGKFPPHSHGVVVLIMHIPRVFNVQKKAANELT